MRTTILTLLLVAAGAAPAWAQLPVTARVVDPPAGYDTGGRRDPFVSLVVPRRPTGARLPEGPRPTGLAGLSLVDAKVSGIVRAGDETMAILEGPDGKSFVVKAQARLLDAEVKSIDAAGVVFIERLAGTPDGQEREVRKPLRSVAEVIK